MTLHPSRTTATGRFDSPAGARGLLAPRLARGAFLGVFLSVPALGVAQIPIQPGVDLFFTPPETNTFQDLQLPPDFFGPGSDPFIGRVHFQGEPLAPSSALGPTDTAVERRAPAVPRCGGPDIEIPIEIVALSLVSIHPITVTYNGGQDPEPWIVRSGLSSVNPQQPGQMTIRGEGEQGGTFSATLPVTPRLVFDRLGPPGHQEVDGMIPPIVFESQGYWVYQGPPEFMLCQSPGTVAVDHDKNPSTPPRLVGPSSNFAAGVVGLPMTCGGPPEGFGKTLTQEEALLARHGVYPAQCAPVQEGVACVGDKCLVTTPAQAAALGAGYAGDGTMCVGDSDGNGRDDACPAGAVPAAAPWGLVGLSLLLVTAGATLVTRRKRAEA